MAMAPVVTLSAIPGATGGASGAIDTTGATLLVLGVSWYAGGTTSLSISDSKANTWIPLTLRNTANTAQRFWYAKNATVGTGHTVTVTAGVAFYPVVALQAFAGADTTAPFDVEAGTTASSGTTLATGSVTPAAAGSLIVSGWAGMNNTSEPTVNAGLNLTTKLSPTGGTSVAGGAGCLIQSTAIAAINPAWSWTGVDQVAVAVAVFKPATAPVAGSFTLVASLVASLGVNGGTTPALTTTGVDLLVLGVAYNTTGSPAPTVSDSKGNTWVGLTARASSNAGQRFFYAVNPTVGTGHTVTVAGTSIYAALVVQGFSAGGLAIAFVSETGSNGTGATLGAPGALTPAVNNCLILSGIGVENVIGLRVDSGLQQITQNYRALTSLLAATGWTTQTTAATVTPAWTWSLTSTWGASVAAFKAGTGSSGGPTTQSYVWGPL